MASTLKVADGLVRTGTPVAFHLRAPERCIDVANCTVREPSSRRFGLRHVQAVERVSSGVPRSHLGHFLAASRDKVHTVGVRLQGTY